MPVIRSLLPTALICIDERERDDYAPFVPAENLLVHPPMDGMAFVINWMMDNVQADILVEVDDDFCGVTSTVGSARRIVDGVEILAILENAAIACRDLGLSTFCFSRTPNTTIIRPNENPIVPVQAVCNAFGVMGPARRRHYDTTLAGRAAVDWTMRTLRDDRLVYCDLRFYFDCGAIFSGRGGNVGLVDPEAFKQTSLELRRRWGRYLSYKPPGFVKRKNTSALSIRVPRRNPSAQR